MYKLLIIFYLVIFTPYLFSQVGFRDSIDVLNYTIHLDLSKTGTKQIYGNTEIKLKPLYELSFIKLDLEGLLTDSVFSDGKKVKYIHRDAVLSIFTDQKLKASDTASILVYYHGSPIKDEA